MDTNLLRRFGRRAATRASSRAAEETPRTQEREQDYATHLRKLLARRAALGGSATQLAAVHVSLAMPACIPSAQARSVARLARLDTIKTQSRRHRAKLAVSARSVWLSRRRYVWTAHQARFRTRAGSRGAKRARWGDTIRMQRRHLRHLASR